MVWVSIYKYRSFPKYFIFITSFSLNVLSKVKVWFSTYLVIPSTLYFGSWILIWGLAQEIESISPLASSFLKIGLFRTHTASFNWMERYFHVRAWCMRRQDFLSELVLLNHEFEVNIYIFATGQVVGFLFLFFLFGFLHFDPSLLSLHLDSLDLFERILNLFIVVFH